MQLQVRSRLSLVAAALAFFAFALPAQPQRGDQHGASSELPATPKKHKPPQPQPRAVAVLEWLPTATETKNPAPALNAANAKPSSKAVPAATPEAPTKDDIPKLARLIPVSIFFQGEYQDAGVYLSEPTPLALQADTVYELEKAGDPAGTFTLQATSRSDDAWVAFGNYKPVPPPKAVVPNVNIVLGPNEDDEEGDRPILRRRHADAGATPSSSASPPAPTTKQKANNTPPLGSDDPDRPTLKQHDAPAKSTTASGNKSAPSSAANGPKTSDDYLNPADDASRPRIKRGSYREQNPPLPMLLGNPANLRQTVAVSDAMHADDHPFAHPWNDDAERQRAQQSMQELALKQISAWKQSQKKQTATQPTAKHTRASTRKSAAAAKPPAATLTNVQFAAYDLAYQDEPTYVFAAQTAATDHPQTYVAVVARPDIYGNLQVAFSAVTNETELALTPRYRLVDAVDASGDGRAELLLEARNLDGRRFVLLDVYRGVAQKVFQTGLLP
jgi:hypothetical protein